jgi:hypothetical protein
VYVAYEGGNVNKTGPSVIYGDTNASHAVGSTENTATSGWGGHAVYVSGFGQRNSDLLSGVNISTSVDTGWDH